MKHAVIPDTQRKPGLCNKYLRAAGRYLGTKQPELIVHLGDHWDFPSLSHYESAAAKGANERDIAEDIAAGNDGLDEFEAGLAETAPRGYRPRKIMLRGNHENRVHRAIEAEPWLEGLFRMCPPNDRAHGWEVVPFLKPFIADGIAYCLSPDHQILTSDLDYIPLGDLEVGDRIVGFTHDTPVNRRSRHYLEAEVEAIDFCKRPVLRIEDSSGKVWYATSDHRWIASHTGRRMGWLHSHELIPGKTRLGRYLPHWSRIESYETGYLAGVFDGEGYVSGPNVKQGGLQIGFGQRDNSVLRRCKSILDSMGVKYLEYGGGGKNEDVFNIKLAGPSGEKAKVIGQINASRLKKNFDPRRLGALQGMDGQEFPVVVSVEPAGFREIAMVKTTSETMIVDGYAHHNCHYFVRNANGLVMQSRRGQPSAKAMVVREGMSCTAGHQQGLQIHLQPVGGGRIHRGLIAGSFYEHDEAYLSPQGNAHWHGILLKHEVHDGQYNLMEVSLDYLKRQWL